MAQRQSHVEVSAVAAGISERGSEIFPDNAPVAPSAARRIARLQAIRAQSGNSSEGRENRASEWYSTPSRRTMLGNSFSNRSILPCNNGSHLTAGKRGSRIDRISAGSAVTSRHRNYPVGREQGITHKHVLTCICVPNRFRHVLGFLCLFTKKVLIFPL